MSSIDSNLIFEQYLTISEDAAPAVPGATAGELKDYPPGTQIVYNNAVYTLPPSHGTVEINTEDPNANINVIDSNGAPFTLPYQATVNGIENKTVTVTPPAPEGAGAGTGAEEPKEVDPAKNMAAWGQAATTGIDSMQAGAGSKDWLTRGVLDKGKNVVQSLSQKAPEQKKGFRKY